MFTCYNHYLLNKLKQQHMCVGCCNYNGLPLKKKAQCEMGRRFQCKGLLATVPAPMTPPSFNSNDDSNNSDNCVSDDCSTTSAPSGPGLDMISPPRKSARTSPRRVVRVRNNSLRRTGRVIQQSEIFAPSPIHKSRHVDMISHLTEDNARLQRELHDSEAKVRQLKMSLSATRMKLTRSSVVTAHRRVRSGNPTKRLQILVQQWQQQQIPIPVICDALLNVMVQSKKLRNEICTQLTKSAQDFPDLYQHFYTKIYQEIKYKFRPWVCLQELDLMASVSFRAYDAIRMIEFAEEESKKYRRGIFYSRHKLTKLCQQLETYGRDILPFSVTSNSVKFDVATAVKFLLEKHGLWGRVLNQENVLLAATVDGGDLAWNVTQVSAGIKMIDRRAVNPVSGTLLFGSSGHEKIQSRFNCYPLHIIIAKDNKQLYKTHLCNFFWDVNELEEDYPNGLSVAQGADMCSLHKTLGVGGGMKVKKYACYCCTIHRDNLTKPLDLPCVDCVRIGCTEPCYHMPMSDESLIERLREEREDNLRAWPHLQRLPFNGRSRIRVSNHGMNTILDPKDDNLHIEFEPKTRIDRVSQRSLFEAEILLRGLGETVNKSTAELRLILHEALLAETSFLMLDTIINANNFDESMIRLEQAVPCLLHIENRTSEAVIEHVLRRALVLREGNRAACDELISGVESLINTDILGSTGCGSLWCVPINHDGTLGKIKFANWRARRVINDAEDIIAICFSGVNWLEERNRWCNVIHLYRRTMKVC
jgi:hypothetical protein